MIYIATIAAMIIIETTDAMPKVLREAMVAIIHVLITTIIIAIITTTATAGTTVRDRIRPNTITVKIDVMNVLTMIIM